MMQALPTDFSSSSLPIVREIVPWIIAIALAIKWLVEFRTKQSKDKADAAQALSISRSEAEKTANEQLAAYWKMVQDDYARIRERLKDADQNNDRQEQIIDSYERKLRQGRFGAQDLKPMLKAFRECVESHKVQDPKLFDDLTRFDKHIQDLIDCLDFQFTG